jgi:hypothetical protein
MTINNGNPEDFFRKTITMILVFLISAIILLSIASCASRTSELSRIKSLDTETVQKEENVVISIEGNSKKEVTKEYADKGVLIKEITTVVPLDNTKDAFVDIEGEGRVKINNSKYVKEKSISNANTTYYETLSLQEDKKKDSIYKGSTKVDKKKEDVVLNKKTKKSSNFLYWLFAIQIALVAGYVYYKVSPTAKVFNILKKK